MFLYINIGYLNITLDINRVYNIINNITKRRMAYKMENYQTRWPGQTYILVLTNRKTVFNIRLGSEQRRNI